MKFLSYRAGTFFDEVFGENDAPRAAAKTLVNIIQSLPDGELLRRQQSAETNPPPDQPRLAGADASHAWVSVYSPGAGWVNVDPTNNLAPANRHVTLAWGRDFSDVSPIHGVILGGGEHTLIVAVDVVAVGDQK